MFKLELYDRRGNQLNIGDIVKISDGRNFTFFAEVKYLENEQILTPFHTFSFHSFEKVDQVPGHAILSTEDRYNIWYVGNAQSEEDDNTESFEKYLMGWRQCEDYLEKRCWRITKQ